MRKNPTFVISNLNDLFTFPKYVEALIFNRAKSLRPREYSWLSINLPCRTGFDLSTIYSFLLKSGSCIMCLYHNRYVKVLYKLWRPFSIFKNIF